MQPSGCSRTQDAAWTLEWSEAGVPGPERLLEPVVQHGHAHGEKGLDGIAVPSLLFGVQPTDAPTLAAVIATIILAGALAWPQRLMRCRGIANTLAVNVGTDRIWYDEQGLAQPLSAEWPDGGPNRRI